jgi:hypothetical protein
MQKLSVPAIKASQAARVAAAFFPLARPQSRRSALE